MESKIQAFDGVTFCGCHWIVSWIKGNMAMIADGEKSRIVHVDMLEKTIDREALRREFLDPYPEE